MNEGVGRMGDRVQGRQWAEGDLPLPTARMQGARRCAACLRPPWLCRRTHRSWPAGGGVPSESRRRVARYMAKLAPTTGEMRWAVVALVQAGFAA